MEKTIKDVWDEIYHLKNQMHEKHDGIWEDETGCNLVKVNALLSDELQELEELYEKELVEKYKTINEKNKEIDFRMMVANEIGSQRKSDWQRIKKLQEQNKILKNELTKLQDRELYKEDFADYETTCQCKSDNCDFASVNLKYLKDNSKYDTLPSKEELKK